MRNVKCFPSRNNSPFLDFAKCFFKSRFFAKPESERLRNLDFDKHFVFGTFWKIHISQNPVSQCK